MPFSPTPSPKRGKENDVRFRLSMTFPGGEEIGMKFLLLFYFTADLRGSKDLKMDEIDSRRFRDGTKK